MSVIGDLYRGETNIDFRPLWRRSVVISAVLVAVSLALLGLRGLDLSIDFEGGGVWEVPVGDSVTVADGRDAVDLPDAIVQLATDADGSTTLRVRSGSADLEQSEIVVERLAELADVSPDEVNVSVVGPTWGSQITRQAVIALLIFFVLVALYLIVTLEWRMAVGALVAVLHDLAITAGVYSLFGFEVSPATVIALLTILGYSLYDTVVVYDKVRENQNTPVGDGVSHTELVNRSMNQVLMRSINTTITTVLPVLSMLVIGGVLLGGAAIRDFGLALFIGLVLGTYSSVFVAAPLLAWLKEREPVDDATRRRQARAAEDFGTLTTSPDDDLVDTVVEEAEAEGPAPEQAAPERAAPVTVAGVTPRPRKRKRRKR